MDSTMIYFDCSSMVGSLLMRTISFSVTMSTEASRAWKRYACCWRTRSSIQKTSFFYVETMSVPRSIVFMVFTTNASVASVSNYGKPSPIASTVCLSLQLLTKKCFACTGVCLPNSTLWIKSDVFLVQRMSLIRASFVIFCGPIRRKIWKGGEKMTEGCRSRLEEMLCPNF